MPHKVHRLARSFAGVVLVIGLLVGVPAGCSSPPSVVPLLRGVQRGLIRERQHLAQDSQRSDAIAQAQLDSLEQAFVADMDGRQQLDRAWVTEHTQAYVLARDAVLRQRMNHQAAYRQRRENLDLAIAVQDRAISLIEQQDALLGHMPDLRRWIQDHAMQDTGALSHD
jgi:hypothetical protein